MAEKLPSPEQKIYHYTYTDYKIKKVIFEYEGTSILGADEEYKKATGNDPSKQSGAGCSIEEVKEASPGGAS